jgi:hypothetical protein
MLDLIEKAGDRVIFQPENLDDRDEAQCACFRAGRGVEVMARPTEATSAVLDGFVLQCKPVREDEL